MNTPQPDPSPDGLDPESDPKPNPASEPKSDPNPGLKPGPKPGPKPDPTSGQETDPNCDSESGPKPWPGPDPASEPKRKRGGQPGNKNALKHGFFARSTPEQEPEIIHPSDSAAPERLPVLSIPPVADQDTLNGIRRLIDLIQDYINFALEFAYKAKTLQEANDFLRTISFAGSTLARLIKLETALYGANNDFQRSLNIALDQVKDELHLDED